MSLSLEDFRVRMRAEIERTKSIKSVQVSGHSLEDALKQASLELSRPLRTLEYEILDKGKKGIIGLGRTSCRIVVYESQKTKDDAKNGGSNEELDLDLGNGDEEYSSVNGLCSIRFSTDGVLLKVFPPSGDGIAVELGEVLGHLQARQAIDINIEVLTSVVEQAGQIWVKVGEFEYITGNDAMPSIEVSEDEMKVSLTVQKPGLGGLDVSAEDIRDIIMGQGIVHGILEDVIQKMEAFPVHDNPLIVVRGTPPIHGNNAKILYNFETSSDKIQIKEREDGSVDFKELHNIHNVVKGQTLLQKIPPEEGVDGQTVFGVMRPARNGSDIDFPIGRNVSIINNSMAIADVDGHVILKLGRIHVDTLLTIPGNVDLKTGNIDALASVEIKGNIEDGYTVKAQGNIAVSGYVSKANLEAGGDIIVSKGINGGESDEFGRIIAGKSIWSSFIQNAHAEAGEHVIVSSGIVNSDIIAQKKVLCKGKRAKIVGGHIQASEEINAVIFGSVSGVKTVLEVGLDPQVKAELDSLLSERDEWEKQRSEVHINLQGLIRQVQIKRIQLTVQKKTLFKSLRLQFKALNERIKNIDKEILDRQERLDSLLTTGNMSASNKIFSGVRLKIKDIEYVVRDSYEHAVSFVLDGEHIRMMKYQAIEEDITRR